MSSKRFTLSDFDNLLEDLTTDIDNLGFDKTYKPTSPPPEEETGSKISDLDSWSYNEDDTAPTSTLPPVQQQEQQEEPQQPTLRPVSKSFSRKPDNGLSRRSLRQSSVSVRRQPSSQYTPPPQSTNNLSPVPYSNKRASTMSKRRSQLVTAPRGGTRRVKDACAKCQAILHDTQYVAALGRFYHVNCFSCFSCSATLRSCQFYEDTTTGNPFCMKCISSKYNCSACGTGILGTYVYFDDGRHFHPHCVPKSTCGRCNQAIMSNYITALNKKYHPTCFVCFLCSSKLTGEFMVISNNPYCRKCHDSYSLRKSQTIPTPKRSFPCSVCSVMINSGDEYLLTGDASQGIHKRCFVCYNCRQTLDPQAFYRVDDKISCPNCIPR